MAIVKPNKIHTIPSSGLKYAYVHLPPLPNSMKPTLLFVHGFPATSAEWSPQISHFHRLGYGILAPDCIGYGGSSKPLDVQHYVGKAMASDIISIMNVEGLWQVIGISHDWGTYLLSQLAVWFEERFEKLVFFSVPFSPPGRELDVRKINETTKRKLGYEQYGYQIFLASEGSGKILGDHWESFFHLAYCANPDLWATSFAPTDGLKSHLLANNLVPLAPYVTSEAKVHHHATFGDDYSAPCMWYVRGIDNLGVHEERAALKKGEIRQSLRLHTLMVTGLRDKVCPADHTRISMNGTVDGGEKGGRLRVVDVDAGHWIMLEKAEETNRILEKFFESSEGLVRGVL